MNPGGRRQWLRLLTLILALIWWTPEQLWANRRVLFWLALAGAFVTILVIAWSLYRLRGRIIEIARTVYFRASLRATQGYVEASSALPVRSHGRPSFLDQGR